MKRELLIPVLEIIERKTPYINTKEISDKLGIEFHMNGDLLEVLNYLADSKKVHIIHGNHMPVMMNGAETLKMLPAGIDLLTELKTLKEKEKAEKQQNSLAFSVSIATIVLALASFIQIGTSLILNGSDLLTTVGKNYFAILIILFFILFIFMGSLILKSYKALLKRE